MFREGKYRSPFDQIKYDEEQRMEKLNNIVEEAEYTYYEIVEDMILDVITESSYQFNGNNLTSAERDYVRDELVKRFNEKYIIEIKEK